MKFKDQNEDEDLELTDQPKIFFCSRTHSQLTQLVREVRRVTFPASSSMAGQDGFEEYSVVKHVPLGSRKNLCINPSVVRLGSAPAISERCLDLQQPGTAKENKCPFLPNRESEALVNDFRDSTLAKIRDIEDLASLGKEISICPYYASRATIKPSEVISALVPVRILSDRP